MARTARGPRPLTSPYPDDGKPAFAANAATKTAVPHQRSNRALTVALGAFGGACALAGVAISLTLGYRGLAGSAPEIAACAAVVAAVALTGTGLLLSRRERDLHLEEHRRTSRAERIQHELDLLGLTPREMTVARLILQHRSYDEIARIAELAPRTVQFHASNVFHKAYVTRRRDFERLMLAEAPTQTGAPYERIPRLRPDASVDSQDSSTEQ